MKDFLVIFGIVLCGASVLTFFIGVIIAIFSLKYRKKALLVTLGAIIGVIIGFGTCAANFSLGNMH